jgi:hypothetical protein
LYHHSKGPALSHLIAAFIRCSSNQVRYFQSFFNLFIIIN